MQLLYARRFRHGIAAAALAAVAIAVITFTPAAPTRAHDTAPALPRPSGITAENGDRPGAVIVSWQAAPDAAGYRVGWIAHNDYPNHFRYADIPAGATAYTVTGLAPGADYWFIVASSAGPNGALQWAERWALLTLPAAAPDAVDTVVTPVGLLRNEPEAFPGYTLFGTDSNAVYLVDNRGRLVHRWERRFHNTVRLLENGNLLAMASRKVWEIAPDGNVLWEYKAGRIHHEIVKLPSGNVLLLLRETKSPAEAIAAGANPDFVGDGGIWNEVLVEVRPVYPKGGEVVWAWSVWDHLIQDFDPGKANYGVVSEHPELIDLNFILRQVFTTERLGSYRKKDWLHANGLDYNPALDQIMFSARNFSEVWIIDHSTTREEAAGHSGGKSGRGGDLLYRWGNPRAYRAGTAADQQLFWQHSPHWIPEGLPGAGNILVLNNGDEFEGLYRDYSSVVEIAPPVDGYGYRLLAGGSRRYGPAEPVWKYEGEPRTNFLAYRRGGAQRLPNGNTLIVRGERGTFFEVTPAGKTVWEYVNPRLRDDGGLLYQGDPMPVDATPIPGPKWQNNLSQALRYPADYPGLQGLDLTPKGTVERYRTP